MKQKETLLAKNNWKLKLQKQCYLHSSPLLKIYSISIIFVAMTQTIGGVLQGLKRVREPLIAISIGSIIKLILNLILVPIEKLNIYGAIIASIVSHAVIFCIYYYYLLKYAEFKIKFVKEIIKPLIATIIMVLFSDLIFNLSIFNSQNINLIFALSIGILIYIIMIIVLRILPKDEINMLPYGSIVYRKMQQLKSIWIR